MKLSSIIPFLVFSVVTPVTAQIDVPLAVSAFEPIVASVQPDGIPEGAELKTTWNLSEGGQFLSVGPSSIHIWAEPGDYKLQATVVWMKFSLVEVDGQELKVLDSWDVVQHFADLTVTAGIEPEPDPDPIVPDEIPEDEFQNIGRSVAAWARELKVNKTKEAAEVYLTASERLLGERQPILATIDGAVAFVKAENAKLGLDDAWQDLADRINKVWKQEVVGRESAGKFLKHVAVGLKGA